MSDFRKYILCPRNWIVFLLVLGFLGIASVKVTLAERTAYTSEEEMREALQDTFEHYYGAGSPGKNMWRITGNMATEILYTEDLEKRKIAPLYVKQYTVTDWKPKWGCFTVTLADTTYSKEFIITKDGCLLEKGDADQEGNRFYPKSGGYYYDGLCAHPFCIEKPEEGKNYCKRHICFHEDCEEPVLNNGIVCEKHRITKEELVKKEVPAPMKSQSMVYEEEMPDCDDYESEEDFLDEWDGFMPDGSDAEDYWADW